MKAPTSLAALLLAFAGPLRAQVPDGYVVVSSFQNKTNSQAGGLFWVHPASPTPTASIVSITGLGCDLTGNGPGCTPVSATQTRGANSVLLRPSDGVLLVGENSTVGDSVDLHAITLAGNAVASDVVHPLGTASGSEGSVTQAVVLDGTRVLVAVRGLGAPGPLAGQALGIVDTSIAPGFPGAVVPVPLAPFPAGQANALALDPSGSTAYFAMYDPPTGLSSIYSVPVPGAGIPVAPTLVTAAPLSTAVSGLVFDCQGRLLAAGLPIQAPAELYEIDTATGAWVPIALSQTLGAINAITIESATGDALVATGGASSWPGTAWRITPSGSVTQLTSTAQGVLGAKSGIALDPNPDIYGAGVAGTNVYGWASCPNTGGLPTVGNAGFAIQVEADPGPLPAIGGVYALCLGQASLRIAEWGVTLLVDLAQPVQIAGVAANGLIQLPIPANPALAGVGFFAQAVYFESIAPFIVGSAPGLEITVLP